MKPGVPAVVESPNPTIFNRRFTIVSQGRPGTFPRLFLSVQNPDRFVRHEEAVGRHNLLQLEYHEARKCDPAHLPSIAGAPYLREDYREFGDGEQVDSHTSLPD